MKKQLDVNITEIIEEAIARTRQDMDKTAFEVAGCDIICIIGYADNTRNNNKRLSLKDYCKENDISHRMVYNILYDCNYIEKSETNQLRLTADGFRELNGIQDNNEEIEFPVISGIDGSLYVDDTHDKFSLFIDLIESHELFDKEKCYNEKLKNKKLLFSRHEKKLAEDLGVKIKEIKLIEIREEG